MSRKGITLLLGDAATVLRELPERSAQCVVTSPPYWGLRDYGIGEQLGLEATPDEYVAKMVTVFREVRRVLRDAGTLWLNLGDSYGDAKQLQGIPWRVAFALQADGWYLRRDRIWHKPNPMPDSVTDRCTKAHEYIFLLSKSPRYYYNAEAIAEPAQCAGDPRNKRSVWTVTTKPFSGAHFATFPPDLIEPCIKAGCPKDGTVLDPFGGAGTTGMVAARLGRNAVLLELNAGYAEMAHARLYDDSPLFAQFTQEETV